MMSVIQTLDAGTPAADTPDSPAAPTIEETVSDLIQEYNRTLLGFAERIDKLRAPAHHNKLSHDDQLALLRLQRRVTQPFFY